MKMIFSFVILLYSLTCIAQTEKQILLSIESVSTTKGLFAAPSIGISKNKAVWRVGPLLGSSFANNESAFGLGSDLLFYPNGQKSDEFNFFFIGNINYFKNTIAVADSETQTRHYQGTIGYGFAYQIFQRISISSNMGLGSIVEIRDFNFETNAPKYKWGIAGLVSFGIQYKP